MDKTIAIIGAGISGLVAALDLEAKGYKPVIFEAQETVGGRVQSDIIDGFTLDRGFQVLLSAYPEAQNYLDYNSLQLQPFKPGCYVFKEGKRYTVGDPLRDLGMLWPTTVSKVGTLKDKLLIFKLSKTLKKTSIDAIFNRQEVTTISYLKTYGFSKAIITDFFQPFFSGIFLETKLDTSSRMFEFIFKMFSEGKAVIPKGGIQKIPDQLASRLKHTQVHTGKKVHEVMGQTLTFEDKTTINFDFCIVATEASQLIPNLANNQQVWKRTQTLYFSVEDKYVFSKPMLGLLSASADTAIINSISFPVVENSATKLMSVSVVKKHTYTQDELLEQVKADLSTHFGIKTKAHIKTYDIPQALPHLENVQYNISPSETQLTASVFLAGDTLLNGSLNAAMLSGALAAQAIHEKITGSFLD